MTIYIFSGTPGSGKSLHAAINIFNQLKYKHPVIANFDLDSSIKGYEDFFTYWTNDFITPIHLMDFSRNYFNNHVFREDEITLYIDEAQLLFNSRDWQNFNRNDWISFLSQHRHFGYRIILISQSASMLDKQIRSLVEYDVQHRKISNFGFGGKLLSVLFGGNAFIAVTVYYGLNDKLSSHVFRGRKKYYRIYNSYNSFSAPVSG